MSEFIEVNFQPIIEQIFSMAKLGITYENPTRVHANANAVHQLVALALADIAIENKDSKLARTLIGAADAFIARARDLDKQGVRGDLSPESTIARIAAIFDLNVEPAEFLFNRFFTAIGVAKQKASAA